jgi:hypothetical protein
VSACAFFRSCVESSCPTDLAESSQDDPEQTSGFRDGATAWRRRDVDSLTRDFNSLLTCENFPVRFRRELGHNRLNLLAETDGLAGYQGKIDKIPCIFPSNRVIQLGDGFAADCFHRHELFDISYILALIEDKFTRCFRSATKPV